MQNLASSQFQLQYKAMINWINSYLDSLSDDDLKMELAPGKNHGVWILGHLIASDDDFSGFMGKGDFLFPEYQSMFAQGAKLQPVENYPPIQTLRKQWKDIVTKNQKIYDDLTDADLNELHANIKDPEKDFFKTKNMIIIYWQLHQMYHLGQLSLLVSKAGKTTL